MSGFMNSYSKYHSPNRRKPVKYGPSLTYLVPRRHRSKLASGNNQTVPEFLTEEQQEKLQEKLIKVKEELIKSEEELIKAKQQEKLLQKKLIKAKQQKKLQEELIKVKKKLIKAKHVTITVEAEQLLDAGESSRPIEISGWTLLVTNLILEIASAVFDQMGYALIGMVLAFVALLLAAVELIHMALKERFKWAAGKRPILPLSHLRSTYTSATRKPVGTIVEYFGLVGAAWQCVYSTVEYTYTRQDKDNPIKMSLLPLIFLFCVVISKLLVDKRSIDKSSLLVTNLILEIASAVFDQTGYALIGMVLAFIALLLATVELIHMARKERIIWAGKRPILPLHTSATRKPVGTIVEYFGLASAVWQCVYSTVEYIYTHQGKDNPIKMYLLPLIFLFCVVISKLLVDKRSIDKSS